MKKYQSHKVVEAARIISTSGSAPSVLNPLGTRSLHLEDGSDIDVARKAQFAMAESGGYYVRYADGYESFSPREAFEEGYTELVIDFGNVDGKVSTLHKFNTFDELEKLLPPLLMSSNGKRVNWTFIPHCPRDPSDPLGQIGYIGYTEAKSSNVDGLIADLAGACWHARNGAETSSASSGAGVVTDTRDAKPKAPTGPRVTLEDIHAAIASEHYFTAWEGAHGHSGNDSANLSPAASQALGQVTYCVLILKNGHRIVGVNEGPVSAENFDSNMGRKYAHEDAIEACWPLFGFALKDRIYRGQ